MLREFKAFLLKENVLALAIAVVIGAALGKVVTAVVDDLVMPVVAVITPSGNWREATLDIGRVALKVGDLAGALVNFLIVGFVVWRISKAFIKETPTSPTMPCPHCRMTVDAAATRCAHCTSQLGAAVASGR